MPLSDAGPARGKRLAAIVDNETLLNHTAGLIT